MYHIGKGVELYRHPFSFIYNPSACHAGIYVGGGRRGTAPLILNLSTRFCFRPRKEPPVAAAFEADYSQYGRRK